MLADGSSCVAAVAHRNVHSEVLFLHFSRSFSHISDLKFKASAQESSSVVPH